jgi:hypothetical protein
MSWNVTMLFVHLAALLSLGALSRDAPDVVQRIVIATLLVALAILCYYYAALLFGLSCTGYLSNVAHEIEHVSVLLYVFRIFLADQERRCLRNSLQHSHSSQL